MCNRNSCRWTAYDQERFGIEMPDYVLMKVTDRASTSPIWCTPANDREVGA